MDKDISTLLREIKDATGWSQPRLADALVTSQPTVNRILKGQTECKSTLSRAIEAAHKSLVTSEPRRRRAARTPP